MVEVERFSVKQRLATDKTPSPLLAYNALPTSVYYFGGQTGYSR